MSITTFFGPEVFTWVIMPLLIMLARVCDVPLGTMRIIFIGRGYKFVAPLLGFFEVLIWLLAITQIMRNLTNILYYLAYSGGFALGTFGGMYIEERLAIGIQAIRIITREDASELIDYLRSEDYGVTTFKAQGASGEVHIIYTVLNRSDIQDVVRMISRFNPKAFYSIEDVRFATEGVFPLRKNPFKKSYLHLLRMRRKEK